MFEVGASWVGNGARSECAWMPRKAERWGGMGGWWDDDMSLLWSSSLKRKEQRGRSNQRQHCNTDKHHHSPTNSNSSSQSHHFNMLQAHIRTSLHNPSSKRLTMNLCLEGTSPLQSATPSTASHQIPPPDPRSTQSSPAMELLMRYSSMQGGVLFIGKYTSVWVGYGQYDEKRGGAG